MSGTIYALATPPGKSGVAVIRLSGAAAFEIAAKLTGAELKPRHAHFLSLKNHVGEILDEAVVIGFTAPASFTGEDVVELQIHGSPAGIAAVSDELEYLGAILAQPGEFTRRALENGKLDMLQVESLADFINSDTESQRKQSLKGYLGQNTAWVDGIKEKMLQTMSLVTLSIDFSDEELPDDLIAQIQSQLRVLGEQLEIEITRSQRSASLKDGFRVAILGLPNVGKSTLLNTIAGREVAIATEIPGTTRDVIEVFVDLDGLPIIFMDTAGIRETDDLVESIGVERAIAAAENADLRIFLYVEESELSHFEKARSAGDLIVQSKSDLQPSSNLSLSAKTGQGVDELLALVKTHFSELTREMGRFHQKRQIEALEDAAESLRMAHSASLSGELEFDIVAEYLRRAVFALDYLVGRIDVEDMLDVIFSQFCIGK